jgi:transposase
VSRNLFWLSDEQWKRIELFSTDVRGVERVDDRRVISGIVQVLKSGCRGGDCPAAYGPTTTIYNRFVRWARREGLGKSVPETCRRSATPQMIDSTQVKAHRSAAAGKGGAGDWPLKRRAQHEDRLLAILLTGGEAPDCPVAERLIAIGKASKRRIGDKASGSAELPLLVEGSRNQASHSPPQQQKAAIQLQQAPPAPPRAGKN